MNRAQYEDLMKLAEEQTVVGLVAQGLMTSGVKMDADDVPLMYGAQQLIRRRNGEIDEAVVTLCRRMAEAGIRIVVMKGQTLAVHYPDPGLRQSGDIDFYCHPEDWEKAMGYIKESLNQKVNDNNSQKHVEFKMGDIQYEMHCMLTEFACPAHQKYWDRVVVPLIWEGHSMVGIAGDDIPTLSATYNVLYTFIHIFYHLIYEGIGLRQFCDLAMVLEAERRKREKEDGAEDMMDVDVLERHLEGIGLKKAFMSVGAVLVEHIGLSEEAFPFVLCDEDKKRGEVLLENVFERGNFGHNVKYVRHKGPLHGLQHLVEMGKQTRVFYSYAPAEVLWRIPEMFKWWGIKLWRMMAPKRE